MNIKTIISNFFYPRFSTKEIETSKLKCNLLFDVTDMLYDDMKKGFPTHILGYVKTRRGHRLPVSWNQHGECMLQGKRTKSFDLIRPSRLETDAAKPVINSLSIALIVIIICIIF